MANTYSQVITALQTALSADLIASPYSWPASSGTNTGLVVSPRLFHEARLPAFTRYAIILSPNISPWEERRVAVPSIEYIHRVDLIFLVKNFDESDSLFGETNPDRGLFQLIKDVKEVLRISTLGGLVVASNKTYDEPSGPLVFNTFTSGFDSGEKTFVHRARLVFEATMTPFCHPRL